MEDILSLSEALAGNGDVEAERGAALFGRHQTRLFALACRLSQDREMKRGPTPNREGGPELF